MLAMLSVLSLAGGAVKATDEAADVGADAFSASVPVMIAGFVAPSLIPSPSLVWGRGGARSDVPVELSRARSEDLVSGTAMKPPAEPSLAASISDWYIDITREADSPLTSGGTATAASDDEPGRSPAPPDTSPGNRD